MSKNSSFYAAFMCILCCSAAVALQPTVRAGSISLNSGIKPNAGNITTTTTNTNVSTDSTRGSALTKFTAGNVVPVSRPSNNNNTQPSSTALDELRTAIDNLRAAQLRLENDQLTRSQVEDAIEDTVKSLDLTTTNTPLKNTLTELRSSTQNLQSDIATLQDFNEDLDVNLDNRLKVRGLIGGDNRPPFATKTEIEPTVLAQKIVTDVNATETLSNKIKPKTEDIQAIIRQDLIDKEILTGSGALNVEKKGEVQVTEATVTNVLRNSNNFKQMVSDEVATKGYVTDTALNERGFVTNDALNNKKFLSTDSATFNTLATKTDIAPATIAAGIADSESAKQALAEAMAGKIGPNEAGVKGLISNELQRLQIIDGSDQLKVASTTSVDPVTIARSIAKSADAKAELSGQIGPNTDTVDNLITQKLKDKGLVDSDARRAVLTSAELETTLASKKYATTDDLPTVDEATVSAALANSQTLDNTIVQNLVNKRLLKENGDLNVAPVSIVNTVNTLNGGINDDGSLLKRIATDETLRDALKGEDGKDGSGFTFKGNITSYSELSSKTKAQGDAWYNEGDTLLYICSCDTNGANCAYPANGKGVPFRGEKGDKGDPGDPGESADSAWKTYCTATNDKEPTKTNLDAIIKPLYGNDKTCDNFTQDEYTALLGGAKAYCVYVAQTAKSNPSEFLASPTAKNLKRVFGNESIVESLTTQGVGATTYAFNKNMKVVDLCVLKYNEIMNPATVWYSYCTEGTNLTSIIQPLYGSSNVPDCNSFTQEQYNALMGGSKEYCMLIAKNAKATSGYLDTTKGIGKTLEDVFGSGTVSNLKNNGISANVSLNGISKKFVFACAEKYDEIMKPKSAWYSYCTEGDNLTTIIQPLYDASTVPNCDAFTQEQYNALMGGPKAYCLFVAKNVSLSTNNVKNNLKKLFGQNIISSLTQSKVATTVTLEGQSMKFVDACAKKYEDIMAGKEGTGYTYRGAVATYSGSSNSVTSKTCNADAKGDAWYNLADKLLYICACDENDANCAFPANGQGVDFKGEAGENGKTASQIYCEAAAENYTDGTTNLDLIKKLYPTVTSCEPTSFTERMFAAIIGGAQSYCLSLSANFNSGISLDEGIGLKMARIYATKKNVELSAAKTALDSFKSMTPKQRLQNTDFSILNECIANYNRIMSGDDAETVWHAYCMETDDNNVSNLTKIITPLYSNVTSCDQFTSAQYNAIMGGASAYCLSLTQDIVAGKMTDFDTGIGKRLTAQLAGGNKSKLSGLRNQNLASVLSANSDSFRFNGKSLVKACEEKYNEIMAGADGTDAKPVEQQYCEDNIEIVKKLYSKITSTDDCESKFTNADYTAIMGGARAYCLSLVQNPSTLSLSEGIGKRLSDKLGKTAMTAFVDTNTYTTPQSRMALTGFQVSKSSSTTGNFMTACEARYDEIMTGADGKDGIDGDDGDDGESAAYTWCKAHVVATGFRTTSTVKKMSAAKTLNAFAARGNVATGLTKSGNEGYFTSIDACLAAVEADPSLMGGESAEEAQYNSDVKKGTITFTIDANGKSTFDNRKSSFATLIKGAKGDKGDKGNDGNDGESFTPIYRDGILTITNKAGNVIVSENIKGEDGISYMPVINKDKGTLSWKNAKTNEEIKDIETVTIKGDKGDKGDKGNPGTNADQYEPVMADGMLKWKKNGSLVSGMEMKVEGTDGKTMIPTMSSDGTISWSATTDTSPTAPSFNVKTAAVDAVKTSLGGNSSSDLNTLITNKANTAATTAASNAVSNSAVTMTDLVNYINNGLLQVSNGAVVLNTNITTSGLTTGEAASIQKLSGAGSSATASKNFGTISSPTCNNGTCSVSKNTGSPFYYAPTIP